MCLLCHDDFSEMTFRKDRLFWSIVDSSRSRSLVTGNNHQQLISLVSLQFVNISFQWCSGQLTPRLQNSSVPNVQQPSHESTGGRPRRSAREGGGGWVTTLAVNPHGSVSG